MEIINLFGWLLKQSFFKMKITIYNYQYGKEKKKNCTYICIYVYFKHAIYKNRYSNLIIHLKQQK